MLGIWLLYITSIKICIQEWPLRSELDPKIYGASESAITTEIIEREIKGFMTVTEVQKYSIHEVSPNTTYPLSSLEHKPKSYCPN